jgi:hypothetical protein
MGTGQTQKGELKNMRNRAEGADDGKAAAR